MPLILTLKLLLVPSLIGLITLSGRRWGPAVAGWLSAFPVIGGPILFFIAVEHGNQFASTAAAAMMSAVIAIVVFGIAYAWGATRFQWFGSLITAMFFYAVTVLILNAIQPAIYVTCIANIVVIALAPRLFPKIESGDAPRKPSAIDMPLRMAVGALLVFLVTYFAASLGPRMSGILGMFPVMSSVLTVFSHRTAGKGFAVALLKGMLLGWYSFSAFCFTLALMLEQFSLGYALTAAMIVALVIQIATRRFVSIH